MQAIGRYGGIRVFRRGAVLGGAMLLAASMVTQAAIADNAGADDALTAARALVVDDQNDGTQCANAGFTSIQAAVNAASAGDVVRVCPGLYDERVTVNKPLTIRGDAESAEVLDCFAATRPDLDPTREVIVTATADNPTVPIFDLQADNIDLQGFVMVGPGAPQPGAQGPFVQHAVGTAADHSGYRVHHNIIMANTVGIFTRSNGVQPSSFDHNCLRENGWGTSNDLLTPPFDDGITEPLINARIHHNSTLRTGNFAFEALTGSDHVILDHNVSDGDGSGYVFVGTRATTAFANTMQSVGVGIRLAGGNQGLRLIDNTLDVQLGGFASRNNLPNSAVLIQGNTITGGTNPGIGMGTGALSVSTITQNLISGSAQGVVLLANNNNNTVSANIVEGHRLNGIQAAALATGNTFTANQIHSDVEGAVDARDDSFATNGNSWRGNVCETDVPAGAICGVN